ncbi:GntR family transcriptional regulator [Ruminococcus sp.]|uniref:GntR family transcriptional regulator n=1 Tax=Ruminococcus sp. TaxID=41978 RepID=UPI0025EEAE1B|nr:GntR family transcriptional regulator [Ruminococcus sp.]MBQ8967283.1 GntR family transcriptional regulator [Ruminococcus sp.]
MRYNFYSNKNKDIKLAVAIDIVRGKYPIGEKLSYKNHMAEEYGVSRPTFHNICKELSDENIIEACDKGRSFYVPSNTKAAKYVVTYLAEQLKQCSRLLELIGFGAREARNQLYLKQIVNTLPTKLSEMEEEGRIQIYGKKNEEDNDLALLEQIKVMQEDVVISSPELQDIIEALEDML